MATGVVRARVRGRVRVGVRDGVGVGVRDRDRVRVGVGVMDRVRVIRSYCVGVIARTAARLRVRARLAVRAARAIRANLLTGLGLELASDALDASLGARVRRDGAGRTLERLGAAARAPSPSRAGGAPVRVHEPTAAIIGPRRAGQAPGTRRPRLAIVAWLGIGIGLG